MNAVCFYVECTDRVRISLRRFVWSGEDKCAQSGLGYHNAETPPLFEAEATYGVTDGGRRVLANPWHDAIPRSDSRWPVVCACGRPFEDRDEWHVWMEALYRRTDTGAIVTLRDKHPGMMWDAWWMTDWHKGPDGRCLVVVLPNGHEWMIDGRASNCTLPNDHEHKCWVRHGEPPVLTVDKNGRTCNAGAGSIQAGNWHGFLRNGVLEQC